MDAVGGKGGGDAGEESGRGGGVDEELFGGVAHAGALSLGVDNDGLGEGGISGGVEVDEALAVVVFDDGYGAVFGDETDEGFAAARDDAVEVLVELKEGVEGGAIGRGDELHGIGREAGGDEGARDECSRRGSLCVRSLGKRERRAERALGVFPKRKERRKRF